GVGAYSSKCLAELSKTWRSSAAMPCPPEFGFLARLLPSNGGAKGGSGRRPRPSHSGVVDVVTRAGPRAGPLLFSDAVQAIGSIGRPSIGKILMANDMIVAVIDDDQSVLHAIGCLLRAHGYRVEGYTSAEAFLSRGSKAELACLVLDIELGGMSGIELQHHLRASDSKLPIVIVTADEDESTRRKTMDAGCAAYFRKPFFAKPLICAIGKATTQNS